MALSLLAIASKLDRAARVLGLFASAIVLGTGGMFFVGCWFKFADIHPGEICLGPPSAWGSYVPRGVVAVTSPLVGLEGPCGDSGKRCVAQAYRACDVLG